MYCQALVIKQIYFHGLCYNLIIYKQGNKKNDHVF